MKVSKKPAIVDAFQWFPPGDERHDAEHTPVVKPSPGGAKVGQIRLGAIRPDAYVLQTNTGIARLEPGDWIIQTPGDHYPVKADRFASLFDPVPAANSRA